jgi:hypothetical protein
MIDAFYKNSTECVRDALGIKNFLYWQSKNEIENYKFDKLMSSRYTREDIDTHVKWIIENLYSIKYEKGECDYKGKFIFQQ